MARSRAFYEKVLGLQPDESFEDVWQEYDLNGVTLHLMRFEPDDPDILKAPTAAVVLEVDDLDKDLDRFRKLGVPIPLPPNDFEKCKMGFIQDPDRNTIVLHQMKS